MNEYLNIDDYFSTHLKFLENQMYYFYNMTCTIMNIQIMKCYVKLKVHF